MKTWPMVSVIIPNFNGEGLLSRCLHSVLGSDYPNYEVILVDDGSTDRSIQLVQEQFSTDSHLSVICNKKNLGAAAARNWGTVRSKGSIVVYLDNDAEVHPDWLKGLVETLQMDPMIGIAQSKLLQEDGTRIACAGELIIPYIGWIVIRGFGDKADAFSQIESICASSGSMAVKREVIDYMGPFDSNMPFLPFEDLDFSVRAWVCGYRVVLAPTSKVYHDSRAKGTSQRRKVRLEYSAHRNSLRLLLKNFEMKTLLQYLPLSIAAMTFRALVGLQRRETSPFLGLIRGFHWNLVNVRDTFRERRRIQTQLRRTDDKEILREVSIRLSPIHIYKLYLRKGRGF